MNFNRIKQSSHPLVNTLEKLLQTEFTEHQLRPHKQLMKVIDTQPNHYFVSLELDNKCCGVIIYWHLLNKFYYIEHFAIFPDMRGNKIGQMVLNHIKYNIGGLWLLEFDHLAIHDCNKLKKWYERNNFSVVLTKYNQPPYVPEEDTTPLWIMTNKPTSELLTFLATIKKQVYEIGYQIKRE
ncbi:N-acetyltransferase domain-containing protein [Entamoeba marina]